MFGSSEILEINRLVVEDFIVEGCLERCSRVGDGTEIREREKFVFFENYVARDNELLSSWIPKSKDVVSNVAEKTAFDRSRVEFGSFCDDFCWNTVKSDTSKLAQVVDTWLLAKPDFMW